MLHELMFAPPIVRGQGHPSPWPGSSSGRSATNLGRLVPMCRWRPVGLFEQRARSCARRATRSARAVAACITAWKRCLPSCMVWSIIAFTPSGSNVSQASHLPRLSAILAVPTICDSPRHAVTEEPAPNMRLPADRSGLGQKRPEEPPNAARDLGAVVDDHLVRGPGDMLGGVVRVGLKVAVYATAGR